MRTHDNRFCARSDADLLKLVREHPLAWIVSGSGDELHATLMPIRPWHLDGEKIIGFASHLPRAHPQVRQLERSPTAWLLFLGPHGYVSPSWMVDRTQAPTWNFASARFRVHVEFMKHADELRAHLEDLVDAMEDDRGGAWQVDEMGERLQLLMSRIIGFVAYIDVIEERFKLGQDERGDTFREICRGLKAGGQRQLLRWMLDFNPDGKA